jgi:hypothetical protein
MRTFSCFIYRSASLEFFHTLAANEERARVLAEREFVAANANAVQLHDEDTRLVWAAAKDGQPDQRAEEQEP